MLGLLHLYFTSLLSFSLLVGVLISHIIFHLELVDDFCTSGFTFLQGDRVQDSWRENAGRLDVWIL